MVTAHLMHVDCFGLVSVLLIRYDRGEYTKLAKILRELHKSCQKPDGSDDTKKGTQLLGMVVKLLVVISERGIDRGLCA